MGNNGNKRISYYTITVMTTPCVFELIIIPLELIIIPLSIVYGHAAWNFDVIDFEFIIISQGS